ncbi:Cnn2 [Lemmus lemmus]
MSSTQFSKGLSYEFSAKVRNRLLSKYDPQKEAEFLSWSEVLTGLSTGPDFQKGLKDGVILCTLMNKLQPDSVPKINSSMQNWRKAKTNGLQSGVDIGVKYSEKQERNFNDATMKAGQCVIELQMGTNKCASQSGLMAYGTRRFIYDPKNHILPPMDHCTWALNTAGILRDFICFSKTLRPHPPLPRFLWVSSSPLMLLRHWLCWTPPWHPEVLHPTHRGSVDT